MTVCIPFFALSRRVLTAVVLGSAAIGAVLAGAPESPQKPAPERSLFEKKSPAGFLESESARETIDPAHFREESLSAAIFHETNARRAEHALPPLAFQPLVRAAALTHARQMAEGRYLAHEPPTPSKNATPLDRLRQQGLDPRFYAENIAFTFVLRYESGKPFHTRQEGGRPVYSYQPGGEPLPRHTYASFAEAVLTQWMNSPLHRKNILAPESEFLGVGSALSLDKKGFDVIYCDQDFFAPLPPPPSPSEAGE